MARYMTRTRLALAAAAAIAIPVAGSSAATFNNYWSAGMDGNYNVPANWSEGVVPFSNATDQHSVYINTDVVTLDSAGHTANAFYMNRSLGGAPAPTAGTTLRVMPGGSLSAVRFRPSSGSIVSIEGGSVTGTTEVAIGYQGSATLNLSAGSLNGSTSIGHGSSGVLNISGTGQGTGGLTVGGSSGITGEVNQTGGGWAAAALTIGSGGVGTYNLEDGVVTTSSRLRIGNTSAGTVDVSGGSLTASAFTTYLGGQTSTNGVGTLIIRGGTTTMGQGMIMGGDSGLGGTGTLQVIGSEGAFTLAGAGLDVHPNSTLVFEINPTGISTIDITAGSSLLSGTLDVDLGGGYAPAVGQTFDLISSAAALDTTGLTLALEDQGAWNYGVFSEEGRNILRVERLTPVPEPVALPLVAFGLSALAMRRRRA